ncbi:Carbohydrate binding module (family 35) [Jatrophihabitans endophyticus]|uniref:Carbohydrate binding module (Family 35) n=1 Tax=Jatrophihabitans endophyticus TaxID=1206085 RepID=A0A1M5LYE6_9ACTN|nr:family 43 glycosylhydrolase [Jatrophihabitans endophyticus]SHG70134.1 Carbohydrate binding module (family 35) [Jatrophihabitans endophyticus]
MTAPSAYRRCVLAAVAALVLLAGLLPPAAPASAHAGRGHVPGGRATAAIHPVVDANFPDPDVLQVGRTYHAYATNSGGQNIQHRTSTDLVHWTKRADALPTLGDWVGDCTFTPGGATDHCVWAPEVSAVRGGYVMYYTARDELAPRQCIGAAFSTSPNGPFAPIGSQPLVCPDGQRGTTDLGGAIDASTYREHGQLYLLWKTDGNCCSQPARIFVQPLTADGRTLTGTATELIHNDRRFEGAVVEAPDLVKHHGTYYLFYSANDFGGGNYRTGYATANSLTGPYTTSRTELMTTDQFHGGVVGPGGEDVVTTPSGGTAVLFHGWDPTYSYRALYVSALDWSAPGLPAGQPHVVAADRRYQAEDGTVGGGRVVADDTASGEAKVGGLDDVGSAVSLRVYAERSGRTNLGIRYDNGSRDDAGTGVPATDTVTVNGRRAGVLTLPNTAWGNWQTVSYPVRLARGWNTVTLAKRTWYAEIDAVDVQQGRPLATPAPVPTGPATRYEAESGVVTHARVVDDALASGGAKVGGLDLADSSVTLTVSVARAGSHVLGIRYGNGSLDNSGYPVAATDAVTVNGRRAGTITFRNTTWDNWQVTPYRVRLHRGSNTITFTKSTFYTELDAVDVY